MHYSIYATLILLVLVMPAVADTSAEAFKRVQENVQQRKFAEAVTAADDALQADDLPPAAKARLLKVSAEAAMSLGRDQADEAIARYERIVADPAIAAPARLDALRAIADVQIGLLSGKYLHEMDLSAAHQTLARGPALPELSPHDRATARTNIARLFERENKNDDARRVYQQILGLEVNEPVKTQAHHRIANTLIQDGRTDEAVSIYHDRGLDLIELYRLTGDNAKRHDECVKVLEDADVPEPARWNAFSRMPCWDWNSHDFAGIREAAEAYLPGFMESDLNRALILRQRVMNTSAADAPAFIEWAAPILMKAPRLSDDDYSKVYASMIDALAIQKKTPEMIAAAQAMSSDERVPAERRLAAKLTVSAHAGMSEVDSILDAAGDVPATARAEALLQAARTTLRADDESTARALHEIYQNLLTGPDRASITCRFTPDAPFDIGSWLASPIRRDAAATAALDRPYGSNLEFLLLTDSAVTGRNVGTDAPEGDVRTEFHTASDEQGIHLFLFAPHSQAADVPNAAASGGSFEIYFTPGDGQAYYTFLIDTPDGRVDPQAFITMYPNARFRLPSIEQGTMRAQSRAVEGGFATHLFLSWELFHDRLPGDGDRWQFEAIHWTQAGGFSFGGSQSVHNRSSWGDIIFVGMNVGHLDAIKRRVMVRAAAKYQAARRVTGSAGQWNDPELGDPAFFAARVKPLLDRLDEFSEMLKKDLTAEQVGAIYREAVPGWMETGHIVEAMRAEYLLDRHFGDKQLLEVAK